MLTTDSHWFRSVYIIVWLTDKWSALLVFILFYIHSVMHIFAIFYGLLTIHPCQFICASQLFIQCYNNVALHYRIRKLQNEMRLMRLKLKNCFCWSVNRIYVASEYWTFDIGSIKNAREHLFYFIASHQFCVCDSISCNLPVQWFCCIHPCFWKLDGIFLWMFMDSVWKWCCVVLYEHI